MQTKYITTNSYVQREGNIIDFCEYRSRMQGIHADGLAAGDSVGLTRGYTEEVTEERAPVRYVKPPRRKHFGLADVLEICASVGVLAAGVHVWAQFLF